ncbi:unnamed protein product, partial [Allacma fusca]
MHKPSSEEARDERSGLKQFLRVFMELYLVILRGFFLASGAI